MPATFRNVSSDYLKHCFKKAYCKFPKLQRHNVQLQQLAIRGFTMRAQPVFNLQLLSRKTRSYRIQMSNHLQIAQFIKPEDLPEEVLIGWFAHELGHVVDYHRRSVWGMLRFIIGYVGWPTYRAGAERQADLFAIDRGFGEQLMATKIYILEKSDLPDHYKKRIRKYYMSPDELELLINGEETHRVHF